MHYNIIIINYIKYIILFFILYLISNNCICADFNKAAPIIIKYEGVGYHWNKKDPGGPTSYGWTLKTYRSMVNKNATISTLQSLTKEEALEYYKKYWWDKFGASKIKDQDLAIDLILAQINLGPMRPNEILQGVTNDICDNKGIAEDGNLGSSSIYSINHCDNLWPAYPYILFYIYSSNASIDAVWVWAKKGLRKRVLHTINNKLCRR